MNSAGAQLLALLVHKYCDDRDDDDSNPKKRRRQPRQSRSKPQRKPQARKRKRQVQRKGSGPPSVHLELYTRQNWRKKFEDTCQGVRETYFDRNRDLELDEAKKTPSVDQKKRLRRISNKWLQNFTVWKQKSKLQVLEHLVEEEE